MGPRTRTKKRRKTGNTADAGQPPRHGDEHLKRLLDLSADWCWEQDENFRFTEVTGAALERSGFGAPEFLGTTHWDGGGSPVGAGGSWDRHKAALQARQPFTDLLFKRPNSRGELRFVSSSGQPMFDDQGQFRGYRGIARDVTRRVQMELRLAIEHAVTRVLAESNSITEAAPQIIRVICQTLQWSCGARWEPDERGDAFHCAETWGIASAYIDTFLDVTRRRAPSTQPGGLIRRARTQGKPLWIRDVTTEATFRRAPDALKAGLHSAFAFPIKVAAQVVGVLEFFSREIHQPDAELLDCTTYVGTQIGQFMQRTRAEERRRESEARFRNLIALSSDFFWETDTEHRLVQSHDGAGHRAVVARADRFGKARWEMPSTRPDEAGWAAHRATLDAHLPFHDFELARIDPEGVERHLSISGEPIFDVTGAFRGYRGVGKDTTARKREEQLLKLEHTVTRCLSEADSASGALQSVMRAVCETQGWECGRYFRKDETGVFRFAESWYVPSPEMDRFIAYSMEKAFAPGVGIVGKAGAGEPLWVADVSQDARVVSPMMATEHGMRGAFMFAVKSADTPLGVLSFTSREIREPDERLLQAVQVIGSQIGQFLQRKQAEKVLRESEARFRAVVDSVNEGILVYDRSLRVIGGNAAAERIIGLPLADIIGAAGFTSLLPCVREDGSALEPEDRPTRMTVRLGKPLTARIFGIKRHDGSVTWLSVNTAFLHRAGEPDYYGVVSTLGDITDQRVAEAAVRESEERFRSLTELSSDWFWEQDSAFRFTRLEGRHVTGDSSAFKLELGKTPGEIGVEIEGASQAYHALLEAHQPFRDVVMWRPSQDGQRHYMSVSGEPMLDNDSRFIGYRGVGQDITERKRAERATLRLGRMFAALSATNDAILHAKSPEELYQRVCDAAVDGGKFSNTSIFLVEPDTSRMSAVAGAGRIRQELRESHPSIDETIPEGRGLVGIAFRTQRPCVSNDLLNDERTRPWHTLTGTAGCRAAAALPLIQGGRSVGAVLIHYDEVNAFDDEIVKLLERLAENVSFALDNFEHEAERRRAQERIQYLATHDGLTDLPNRVMFSQMLNLAIQSARRYNRRFAVMFLDLDRFKIINDTLGHEAGDELLQEMARRFKENLRSSDVVARLGGDEFVVLLQEVNEAEQVAIVARKLLSAVITPVIILGQECRVTASIGVSMYPTDAQDEQALMKDADIAMYLAKEEGKNNFQFYSKDIKTQSLERLTLEMSLRHALEREEFFLHYQAKLDLATGAITGVEALLRWQHPDLDLVSPAQFIPLAEETGVIIPIGKWVLRTACMQNIAWQRAGLPAICMAVNLSPRQFADENLLNDLAAVLEETGMAPALLELEITESMVMGNVERAAKQLAAIKEMGVRLAIDDFGTGYSSLAQIKRFPIDTIKVDRSFIREIPQHAEDKAITQAIIAMGKTLSLTVVAEGVETQEQQEFLREHACNEMQGYYFSKPAAPEQFAELLRTHVAIPSPKK